MAFTDVSICNTALARVGERQTIGSLADATTAAQLCNLLYSTARDELLVAYEWRWAKAYASLTQSATAAPVEWNYCYDLPTTDIYGNSRSVLVPRYIWSGMRTPPSDLRVPFEVVGNLLYTDYQPVAASAPLPALPVLVYTYSAAVGIFPVKFANALAWRLAVDLSLSLTVKPQVAQLLERKATAALLEAIAFEENQGQEDVDPDSEFIRVRSGQPAATTPSPWPF